MKKISPTADIVKFMQSQSLAGAREVCVVFGRQGDLDNTHMVYLHDSDPSGSIDRHRESGELIGFIWYVPASEERPDHKLFDENIGDTGMTACIERLVNSIQESQTQLKWKLGKS